MQIELEYRYFDKYTNDQVEEWAKFYNLKLLYGMCLIIRDTYTNNKNQIIKFLDRFELGYKQNQIH